MPKKGEQSSSSSPKPGGGGGSSDGGGISGGIRLVSDGAPAPVSKTSGSEKKGKSDKRHGADADGDDDKLDIYDLPFFSPPSHAMLSQRANPPNLSSPMSPRTTDPMKLQRASPEPALSNSPPKDPRDKDWKRSKSANKSGSSSSSKASPFASSGHVTSSHSKRRGSSSSPVNDYAPAHSPRPGGPRRSSSQDGNFLTKVKKGGERVQAGGLMAANFLDKVSHVAWDKLKSPRLPKQALGGRTSPQNGHRFHHKRDTSFDIEVFGMTLQEAVTKTRIVTERKISGDATFWIPAIAYRCLQYLNVYGPGELGIYRISGSTAVVEELRNEFKMKHDVDLFEDPPIDIHTVSSLLKSWFRNLPEGILPGDVQKRIYEKCKDQTDSEKPPQAFIDELSNLPPYNYYLLNHLFSHLSTVCQQAEVNKMNLSNLGMIFCSTLRIDRFCFNWLVTRWADCWAGCLTEEDEYDRMIRKRFPEEASLDRQPRAPVHQKPPPPLTPSYQNKPQSPQLPPTPSSGQHKLPQTPTYPSSETRTSSRGGRSLNTSDGTQDVWATVPNREQLTIPPMGSLAISEAGHKRDMAEKGLEADEGAAHRARMEREREREREREQEREAALVARSDNQSYHVQPSGHKKLHSVDRTMTVFTDGDRYNTMVEPNKSPRQSTNSGDCGRLGLPESLPPIQPLSPMMKEGQNVV